MPIYDETAALNFAGNPTLGPGVLASLEAFVDQMIKQMSGMIFYTTTPPSVKEYHDGGVTILKLGRRPVVEVTTVKTVDTSYASIQTVDEKDYIVYKEGYLRKRKKASTGNTWTTQGKWVDGEDNIEVDYTYGISTTDPVYNDYKLAGTYLLASMILMTTGASTEVGVGGLTSYTIETITEAFGGGGPYSKRVIDYWAKAESIIDSMTGSWEMELQ